jgi:hypothetical protein
VTDLKTRPPTGKPPWPILLIAGVEKAGKSYSAAEASASDLIGRTFWISCGEDDPDEYGAIPGARFEIVEHDGSYRSMLAAITAAAAQPATNGKPNLLVLDSGGRAWALLSGMAQHEANQRAAAKAARFKNPVADDDARISMDLWNLANQRWDHILDALREHQGPTIITARLELTTVMNDKGEPTKEKVQKVQAQKGLPFDAGVIVEMRARNDVYLTGARSLKLSIEKDIRLPKFTVHELWERLGLAEESGTRAHTSMDAADKPAADADLAREELRRVAEDNGWALADIAAQWADLADGQPLKSSTNAAAIRTYTANLLDAAAKEAVTV